MAGAGRTVVITGAEGFVGKWLQKELQRAWPGAELINWDLPAVDITKPETYQSSLEKQQPEWLVHLAGLPGVGSSWQQVEMVRRVNTEASVYLFEAVARLSPATRVLAVSSADIYGRSSMTPLPELPLDQAQPKSPYAQSKWEMEQAIEARFNSQVVRARPFPHLGPGQRTGFVAADFAAQIAAIEIGKQAPVVQVGNIEVQRDFTDVRDVVRAYRLLMERGQPGEVYHVASGRAVSIRTLLEQLLALAAVPITVRPDPARVRPVDTLSLVGDATKLKAATGWQPQILFEQTVRDVLDDWRQRVRAKS